MEVVNALGRRKSAVARVFVSEGTGKITINKRDLAEYFPSTILQFVVKQPLVKLGAAEKYDIKGFVISNICNIKLLNGLFKDLDKYFKLVTNYTFNVFNSATVLELKKLGISTFTISPELDKKTIQRLCEYSYLNKELIIYGRTPLVNMNYCLLGETDKCYPECKARCTTSHTYYLKDRLNMEFPIMPDNIQTVTTLFNSKITSISPNSFNVDSVRIDIFDESNEQIANILKTVKSKKRFEGKDFTSGNLNREI